jgi:hypothetical protein
LRKGEEHFTRTALIIRHCERSEAIHLSACGTVDCFVASLLATTTE